MLSLLLAIGLLQWLRKLQKYQQIDREQAEMNEYTTGNIAA